MHVLALRMPGHTIDLFLKVFQNRLDVTIAIAKLLHPELPDIRFVWREDLQRMLVVAIRPIRPGDEITVTYKQRYQVPTQHKMQH